MGSAAEFRRRVAGVFFESIQGGAKPVISRSGLSSGSRGIIYDGLKGGPKLVIPRSGPSSRSGGVIVDGGQGGSRLVTQSGSGAVIVDGVQGGAKHVLPGSGPGSGGVDICEIGHITGPLIAQFNTGVLPLSAAVAATCREIGYYSGGPFTGIINLGVRGGVTVGSPRVPAFAASALVGCRVVTGHQLSFVPFYSGGSTGGEKGSLKSHVRGLLRGVSKHVRKLDAVILSGRSRLEALFAGGTGHQFQRSDLVILPFRIMSSVNKFMKENYHLAVTALVLYYVYESMRHGKLEGDGSDNVPVVAILIKKDVVDTAGKELEAAGKKVDSTGSSAGKELEAATGKVGDSAGNSAAGKNATKEVMDSAGKNTAWKEVDSAGKDATKEEVDSAGKDATKEVVDSAVKDATKEVVDSAVKDATEEVVYSAVKDATKEVVDSAAKRKVQAARKEVNVEALAMDGVVLIVVYQNTGPARHPAKDLLDYLVPAPDFLRAWLWDRFVRRPTSEGGESPDA